ncbi:MAG: TonB-dependent receptor [Gammaproteobacteria bacterium]|nr:TonB-dependent receptor [Gammaproteobacteria bacterium]
MKKAVLRLFDMRLKTLLCMVFTACIATFAWGQDESTAADETNEVEEVIVTGSYIKGTPEDAALPVTTLTREELTYEGSPTVLDLVKNLSFSQGADGETDQFQAGAGADRATINIRGLGPSRSLVLVNGQRTTWSPHAIGAQAQLLVDVNAIPSVAIQRIELLRDGAAATYGSDAIAGVMNFITRRDFVGFEVSGNHKAIADSDGDTEFGAIWGREFADGRGHLVSSISAIDRGELAIADRDWGLLTYAESPTGGWSSVGRPSVVVPLSTWNFLQSLGVGGFAGLLVGGIVDPNCETLGGARTTVLPQNPRGGFCRFQYTAFDNLAEEAFRAQWFTEASWEITDTTTIRTSMLMTDSSVPNWKTSPSYPPNRLVDSERTIRANNPGLIDMASKYPELYGSMAACAESYCTYAGDPTQTAAGIPLEWQEVAWFYGRYYGQDGPLRSHRRDNDLVRFEVELDGEWDDRDWRITSLYSSSKRFSEGGDTMVYRDARARQGLGGFECEQNVPNEYDANGNLSFSLDTLMNHAGQGPCRYWIPFSNSMAGAHPQVANGTAVNPDFNPALDNQHLLDYMVTTLGGYGETSLFVLEGVLGGELDMDLGGGAVDFAGGAHFRHETYQSGPLDINNFDLFPCAVGPEIQDCTTRRNGLFGFLPPSTEIDQSRSIYALFGELNFPMSDTLEAQLSLRFEDYGGETGSSLDPKAAIRWQLMPSVGLRASVGTTFRGPTLNQTVADDSSNSLQYVAATGAFKRVDTKGNPMLEPEEATTINAGLLIDHDDLLNSGDNVFMTLDYWSYDFQKPLVTEPFGAVLNAACPGGVCDESSPYFDRLAFGGPPAAANLEIIDVFIINGPDIKTTGIDFSAAYEFELGEGIASIGMDGTRILNYEIDSWVLGGAYDALGSMNYGTSLARSLVELKGRVTANYAMGPLNLRYNLNYIDEYERDTADVTVESQITHDLHANYRVNDDIDFWGSLINASDEDPPFTGIEMNYDAFTHNPFGRIIKFGMTYSFGQ